MPFPSGTEVPPGREVPGFAPVRVRGGRAGLRRLVRHRRRAVAAGLAVTAAALVAAGPRAPSEPSRDAQASRGHPVARPGPEREPGRADERRGDRRVTAPVRIADAATARLLRPGDRVDVIAAEETATGQEARVVARGAVVSRTPEPLRATADPDDATGADLDGSAETGALVLLSVPRSAAADLAGASATARLAVTLW
ncbi:RcpC/CpaB family pilus assembly protein [Streptomyces broussonetiae]|uniref:RcpC/CpaB family pilus assembly protein n=1 Tax=Streptomyces broussonetiae TaxID=2686304 RepID=A0ABV5EK00_9ACTN